MCGPELELDEDLAPVCKKLNLTVHDAMNLYEKFKEIDDDMRCSPMCESTSCLLSVCLSVCLLSVCLSVYVSDLFGQPVFFSLPHPL